MGLYLQQTMQAKRSAGGAQIVSRGSINPKQGDESEPP